MFHSTGTESDALEAFLKTALSQTQLTFSNFLIGMKENFM